MNTQLKKISGVALAITLSLSATAQAEGFLSNLFDGSKDSAGFKSLLQNVPADTAYLIGNKNPIPEKEMKEHIKRTRDALLLMGSSKSAEKKESETPTVGDFFDALIEEYSVAFEKGKGVDSGLYLQASSVLYGYEAMPVVRMNIEDKDKLIALIKRAEKKSKYSLEFSKCGEFDCFESTSPDGEMSVAAVLLEDHIALSAFTPDKKENIKKHLVGEAKPKTPYSEKDWDAFLKENNYPGYGDGFISLNGVFNFIKPMLTAQMQGLDEKTINGCLSVAEDHIKNVPEIVLGTKEVKSDLVDYELLFKTSDVVSTALQTIANETNISHSTEGAIFDVGFNINLPKLRDALTQYSGFLIKSGETNECPMVDPQQIRQSMGSIALVMNMGLSQFKSVYASISDVQLDSNMQPKKIDAVISLGSDNPSGLIAMAGSMIPPLATLKIPEDGSVAKLPEGIVPPAGANTPEVFLSKTDKAINIFIGNDKPTLIEHKNDISEISFSNIDMKGYMTIVSDVIASLPKGAAGDTPDAEALKKIGENSGTMSSTSNADKRGLVLNYRIKY